MVSPRFLALAQRMCEASTERSPILTHNTEFRVCALLLLCYFGQLWRLGAYVKYFMLVVLGSAFYKYQATI